ncbi:MAG: protein-L-isoaspartate(D-aspartate) O-methyltransferase [Candidatus Eisenbacteria bacterium]|nr:protein-L-isoaspartate(D-aspartate) O-methyltransferase [Candidatus Eisenbacteria bacterium]
MDYRQARQRMVEVQLEARGIRDARVLEAFRRVPRHEFVEPAMAAQAYADRPLPIGHGQTISQPYMVAIMTELLDLQPDHRVLEIGTGSGYQAAILAELARSVFTVERMPELARAARERFDRLGLDNILQRVGDGTLGWKQYAPYDRIVVTAGAPRVPASLRDQLVDGGLLVVPTGSRLGQVLELIRREGERFAHERSIACTFVPLCGAEGWQND